MKANVVRLKDLPPHLQRPVRRLAMILAAQIVEDIERNGTVDLPPRNGEQSGVAEAAKGRGQGKL